MSRLELEQMHAGLGLPCANCKLYFQADLEACPVCNCSERVPPIAAFSPNAPDLVGCHEKLPHSQESASAGQRG